MFQRNKARQILYKSEYFLPSDTYTNVHFSEKLAKKIDLLFEKPLLRFAFLSYYRRFVLITVVVSGIEAETDDLYTKCTKKITTSTSTKSTDIRRELFSN